MNPTTVLCADWGKAAAKRAVYAASLGDRPSVRRISHGAWTLRALLDEARRLATHGPVLVALDVPLGVPAVYLDALQRRTGLGVPISFLDLVDWSATVPRFFAPTTDPREWDLERPFFAVPAGEGGLSSYQTAASQAGVGTLLRGIDQRTGAKPVFVTSGIPGSVGTAACDVWMALRDVRTSPGDLAVWPFEGELAHLTATRTVTLAETYPRAAYATALLDGTPNARPRMMVAKTDARSRVAALEQLQTMRWVRYSGVKLEGLEWALDNEDDFDACITAAALLRCLIEELPLSQRLDASACAEGGILGSGSVNLTLPEVAFRATVAPPAFRQGPPHVPAVSSRAPLRTVVATSRATTDRQIACPIPGCSKVFIGTRGGWDGHVGAVRLHPTWRPEVSEPELRRHLFKVEFPEFFADR